MWTYTYPDPVPPNTCRVDGHDWDDPTADKATCRACGTTRQKD